MYFQMTGVYDLDKSGQFDTCHKLGRNLNDSRRPWIFYKDNSFFSKKVCVGYITTLYQRSGHVGYFTT